MTHRLSPSRLLRARRSRSQTHGTDARLLISKLLLGLGILLLIGGLPAMFSIGPFLVATGVGLLVASVVIVPRKRHTGSDGS